MPLTTGNTLHQGKYLINHVLAQTDIGVTLQGTQVQQNQPVILQVLQPNPNLSVDLDRLKQQFFDQAHRFAHCQHPGLARLIDSFAEEEMAIAVFDHTPGQTLLEVVHTTGALPESQAIQYIQQVGAALMKLHDNGLIHRRITPKNIIRPIGSNIVVLINSGLLDATLVGAAAGKTQLPIDEYAAIEQYQAELAHTPATDIYGLAGTLYVLLTGYAPLAAPLRHRSPLPSPRQLRPHLTATIESAILQGLELNVNARPQAIVDWLALLPSEMSVEVQDSHPALETAIPPSAIAASSEPNSLSAKSTVLPTQRFSAQPNQSMIPSPLTLKNPFPKTMLATAAIAAAVGLGTGLTLRITANSTGPGTSIFHTEQAFPPFENWPGAALLVAPANSYSPPVVEAPNQPTETDNRNQPPAAAQPPNVEEQAIPKPVPEEVAPPPLPPQAPAINPAPPNAIAPAPNIPSIPEPELPPAEIPSPAEVKPEPAPPPSTSAPSSGEVQRQ